MGYSAHMLGPRTTPHIESPPNSTEMASRDYKGNEWGRPQILCQEAQEGPEENAKAMSVPAKAIKILVNPKIPKGIGP